MKPFKLVVRQVGPPNPAADVYSPEEVHEYIQYQYHDYEIKDTHYLGQAKAKDGKLVEGFAVMFVLVKDEEPAKAKAGKNA